MESHNDDNDIGPSNGEELPPGSSTKEPTLVESDTIFLLCKCYFREILKWYLKHI